jgi:hypothetical protein
MKTNYFPLRTFAKWGVALLFLIFFILQCASKNDSVPPSQRSEGVEQTAAEPPPPMEVEEPAHPPAGEQTAAEQPPPVKGEKPTAVPPPPPTGEQATAIPPPPPPDEQQAAEPQPPLPSETDRIGEILKNLSVGSIAFNIPDSIMKLHQKTIVQLLLSPSETTEELQAKIVEEGMVDAARVKISGIMEAQLTGSSGVTVTNITEKRQLVGQGQTTEWKWQVEAIQRGKQTLNLCLNVIVSIDGKDTPASITTFTKEIRVRVSLGKIVAGFFMSHWEWSWAVLIVPAAIWLKKALKKKSKRKKAHSH